LSFAVHHRTSLSPLSAGHLPGLYRAPWKQAENHSCMETDLAADRTTVRPAPTANQIAFFPIARLLV